MEECFLVVYRALGALMCLLIQGKFTNDLLWIQTHFIVEFNASFPSRFVRTLFFFLLCIVVAFQKSFDFNCYLFICTDIFVFQFAIQLKFRSLSCFSLFAGVMLWYWRVFKMPLKPSLFVVLGDQQLDFDLFQKIDKFVGPQLSAIASDIAELTSRKNPRFSALVWLVLTNKPLDYFLHFKGQTGFLMRNFENFLYVKSYFNI